MKLRLGYERGTGEPVEVELSPTSPHIAIFGQTGLGKTVLVRRIMSEMPLDYRVLVFDTREGVEEFKGEGNRIPIYVKQTTDALVLKGLLESIIQSSLKREYATLVRVTEGSRNYKDVIARLTQKIEDKKTHAVVKDMMVLLRDLLQRLIAEMGQVQTATDVDLKPGLNVMSLNSRSKQFKQLTVRAVLPLIYKKYRNLVVFLDEGQEFIPQKYSSAAKEAVDDYIRTARGKDDYMVIAAQSITSTDKDPLKQVHTWVMFGQATAGEAKEVLEYTPHAEGLGVTKQDIQTLPTGFAIVSTKSWAKRTYIAPVGMLVTMATNIAKLGEIPEPLKSELRRIQEEEQEAREMDEKERTELLKEANRWEHVAEEKETMVQALKKELEEAQFDIKTLKEQIELMKSDVFAARQLESEVPATPEPHIIPHDPWPPQVPAIVEGDIDLDTLARKVADMFGSKEYQVKIGVSIPSMTLLEHKVEITASDDDNTGRFAVLVADGFFDERRTTNEVRKEMQERGWGSFTGGSGWNTLDRLAKKFAEWGFLRNVEKGYVIVPEAKKRIKRVKA